MSSLKVLGVLAISAFPILFTACSSAPVARTKWTDKSMRVMIDPDSINEENYVQIQQALVRSGKFTVVDRARGMNAVKKEQELTHRKEEDRFADKEKWSHWGKMYGVGSIIVAHVECTKDSTAFNRTKLYLNCHQFLSMVDSNTGEVFVAVDGRNEGPASYDLAYMTPDWNEVTDKMVEAYPKAFKPEGYGKEIVTYQDVSGEHGQRQRELVEKQKEADKAPDAEKIKLQAKIKELEEKIARDHQPASETTSVTVPTSIEPKAEGN